MVDKTSASALVSFVGVTLTCCRVVFLLMCRPCCYRAGLAEHCLVRSTHCRHTQTFCVIHSLSQNAQAQKQMSQWGAPTLVAGLLRDYGSRVQLSECLLSTLLVWSSVPSMLPMVIQEALPQVLAFVDTTRLCLCAFVSECVASDCLFVVFGHAAMFPSKCR